MELAQPLFLRHMARGVDVALIEGALHELYIAAPGTSLRDEDRKKARELAGLLPEIRAALGGRRGEELVVVDAAAGKAYAGIVALKLLAPASPVRLVAIEREARHLEAAASAAEVANVRCEIRHGDVGEPALWPERPDLVIALHACGPAFDTVAERALAARARRLLLVPCCTGRAVAAVQRGHDLAAQLGVPRSAAVRGRFVQSIVDAERTLALEAAGYAVQVVPFVSPTITPHNLLWRAVRESDRGRAARGGAELRRLRAAAAGL